ncbi:transcriptional repressor LexA [Clostridium tarantellae]|uniref:LexA repressor n=1 Tax=Clostridium tarantellae TaxID=39493 RepID=A0A6I1MLA2_9CLOT|nr:transcriptional repressor LexA [Clostridium tarantellae]MPQ44185.1 transcriptional repressor LexA [Clostridium tarantellae]
MDKKLSVKQEQIYNFLIEFTKSKGYPPSVREICAAVSLKSTSTVHGHLKTLERLGLIHRDPTKPRALEITKLSDFKKEVLSIPILGKVNAGCPILANEDFEELFPIPSTFIKHNNSLYILKVSGDSMIEKGIHHGDLVIIEKCNTAKNGDIVVALIDNEATIKTFYKEKDFIRLQPENKTMEPIIVKHCSISGKLVGLYRSY